MSRITVCIPTLNRSSLNQCLYSIEHQTKSPSHVITVKNKTFVNAIKEGLDNTTDEVFTLIDDDAVIPNDYIENIDRIMENKNIGFVCGSSIPLAETKFEKAISDISKCVWIYGTMANRYRLNETKYYVDETELIGMGAYRTFLLKDYFKQTNYQKETCWENDVVTYIKHTGYVCSYDPSISFQHKPRSGYISYSKQMYHYGEGRLYYLRLHREEIPHKLYFFAPTVFVLTLPIMIIPYIPTMLALNDLSIRKTILTFLTHFSYGLGFLRELLK